MLDPAQVLSASVQELLVCQRLRLISCDNCALTPGTRNRKRHGAAWTRATAHVSVERGLVEKNNVMLCRDQRDPRQNASGRLSVCPAVCLSVWSSVCPVVCLSVSLIIHLKTTIQYLLLKEMESCVQLLCGSKG